MVNDCVCWGQVHFVSPNIFLAMIMIDLSFLFEVQNVLIRKHNVFYLPLECPLT